MDSERPMGKARSSGRHQYVADAVRLDIVSGTFMPGSPLPTHLELVNRFGVSAVTVRHALKQLIRDGFLYTQPRKSTYVVPDPGSVNPSSTPVAESTLAPRHRVQQVYGAVDMTTSRNAAEDCQATEFFTSFLRANGHSDRVVLRNFRNEVGKWCDGVDWEYADGRRVEYPNSYK